jgi:hypothetical protein
VWISPLINHTKVEATLVQQLEHNQTPFYLLSYHGASGWFFLDRTPGNSTASPAPDTTYNSKKGPIIF